MSRSSTPPCSPEVAAALYRRLEYYRDVIPFCLDMSEEKYANTQEAKLADAALESYRKETGQVASPKPTPP